MHTVIIGVGGVGGYFGGKIADSGQKVTLIARGEHGKVIQQNGLKVNSLLGDFTVDPFMVTDTIAQAEKADLILLCTKSWQVKDVGTLIKPILKEDTIVIPLQNGADNAEKLASVIDKKHVLGGLCRIYSKIVGPGTISHFGHTPQVVFGELDRSITNRIHAVKEIFDIAGFKSTVSQDIEVDIWTKFMFIATVSGLGALTRATIGEMYENENTRDLLQQTATEIYKVGIAKGVRLPENSVAIIMSFISKQPYDSTASTQRDIMEGRPSELQNFNGYIVEEGKKTGVSTPVNEFTYSCLQPMEYKARGIKN